MAQTELEKLQKQQIALRQEVMKSLQGESAFETDLLRSMLDENKSALAHAESKLIACQQEKETEEARLQYLIEQYRSITDWAKEFDHADNDTRKMILARLIERIEVDRNYHLTIKFFVTIEEFNQTHLPDQPLSLSSETEPGTQAIAV